MSNNVIRRTHDLKCQPGKDQSDERHNNTAYQSKCNGGMHGLRHLLMLAGSIETCSKYIRSKRDSNK